MIVSAYIIELIQINKIFYRFTYIYFLLKNIQNCIFYEETKGAK